MNESDNLNLSPDWWEEYEKVFGKQAVLQEKLELNNQYGPIGKKDDQQKPLIFKGVMSLFPRALAAVAQVSEYGSRKYSWTNWVNVENGIERYTEALVRHLAAEAKGEKIDPETELAHAYSTCWNALARLELMLREPEQPK